MDYNVLLSNNWDKYNPSVIVIEEIDFLFPDANKSKIYQYLVKKGYVLFAKTNASLIFIKGNLKK